uniref:Uncharacterized protein n=1 Tax=Chrysemys picta bellii TaxID=8478 RepID=A0A8C3FHW1_CHRPI
MALVVEGPLGLWGQWATGLLVWIKNVMAAILTASIVKNSLRPIRLDKMFMNDMGLKAVTTTNDGGTILKQLEVEHSAPTWLCELAKL